MIHLVSPIQRIFSEFFNCISLEESIEKLNELINIGLDSETTGLDPHTKQLLTLQLGCEDFQIVYDIEGYGGKIPQLLKEFLRSPDKLFILQNAKFDLQFLYKQKILLKNVYDTFLAEQIITHGLQFKDRGLDKLVAKYFPDRPGLDKSIRSMIIKTGLNEVVINYAANDVVYLEGIMNKQLAKAKEFDLENCIHLDNLFVRVLAYVEFCGIGFDWVKWQTKSECNVTDAQERKKILDDYVITNYPEYSSGMFDLFSNTQECTINWDSSKQVIPFFEKLGIKCIIRDKGVEKKSIDAKKVLALQRDQFEILPLYLDYKESITLVNTFGLGWKRFINPVTKRIHSSFRQIQDTGRMACGEKGLNGNPGSPNLQNIPADQLTRSCFTADKGNKVSYADYSSQEQRILANFSLVDTLIKFYEKGLQDMHGYVAFLMYPHIRPCELEEITNDTLDYIKKNFKEQRKLAKNAGFAINYGGNGSTISKNCGIPKKQGEFVYDSYFKSFPGLKEYFAWCLQEVKEKGYIQFNDVSKRKYFIRADNPFMIYKEYIGTHYMEQFPNPYAIIREYREAEAEIARLSQNYPIQGSAADMTKLACIAFFNQLVKREWVFIVKMVNIIHDEIGIEAPENIIEEATELLTKCMVKAGDFFKTKIPYFAEAEIGDYWIH